MKHQYLRLIVAFLLGIVMTLAIRHINLKLTSKSPNSNHYDVDRQLLTDEVFSISLNLPCGYVHIHSQVISPHEKLHKKALEYFKEVSIDNQEEVTKIIYGLTDNSDTWGILELSRQYGVIHISTFIAAMIRHITLNIMQPIQKTHAFRMRDSLKYPLTLLVYSKYENITANFEEVIHVNDKAFYNKTDQIMGVAIDSELAEFLFPIRHQITYETFRESLVGVWDISKRTYASSLVHEFTHAFQDEESYHEYYSPVISEGVAEYLEGYNNRLTELGVYANVEQRYLDSLNHAYSKQSNLINKVISGDLLSLSELKRLKRLTDYRFDETGIKLEQFLRMSSDEFYFSDNLELNYDLSWLVALLIWNDRGKYQVLIDLVKDSSALSRKERQFLIDLEKQLNNRMTPIIQQSPWVFGKDLIFNVNKADSLIHRGQLLSAWQVFYPFMQEDSDNPMLMSYLADFAFSTNMRDVWFLLYEDALHAHEKMRGLHMSGRIRLVDRYAKTLLRLGHWDKVESLIAPYVMFQIDAWPLMHIQLLSGLIQERKKVIEGNLEAKEDLHLEYLVGLELISEELSNAGLLLYQVESWGRSKSDLKEALNNLGLCKIPKGAWYRPEFVIGSPKAGPYSIK